MEKRQNELEWEGVKKVEKVKGNETSEMLDCLKIGSCTNSSWIATLENNHDSPTRPPLYSESRPVCAGWRILIEASEAVPVIDFGSVSGGLLE